MRTISVEDIEVIFKRIIEKLRYEKINEIKLYMDLYRFIPTDEWRNYEKDVIELGSLKDDVEALLLMANDIQRPCTYVDFDRLASLLRAISQKNNSI